MAILSKGSKVNSKTPIATALRIQSSVQGVAMPFVHGQQRIAGNLIWYGNFSYNGGSGSGKGGKGGIAGGGGKAGGSGASYSASFMLGICEGPVDAILELWDNKTPEALASQGVSAFDGYQGQPAWSYLSSADPSQALGYSSMAYAASANYNLGNQPELPNFNFEVRGAISGAVSETYTVGSPYTFTPSYFGLSSSLTEAAVIPATPYQFQAQNYQALTALPVVLGNLANPVGTASAGVVDSLGNVFALVGSGPTTGQYSVSVAGLYQFAVADAGKNVTVIDLAIGPGVSYIYQPTATLNGTVNVTGVSSTANLVAGMLVTAAGIPAGTVIISVGSDTLTLSQAATASGGATLTCWGNPLAQVLGAPLQGQFSISVANGSYGEYTFSSADNGALLGIIDVVDADPSLSLTDFLTNPRYGVGFPAANIGSLTSLQQFTFANGLFISPAFAQAQAAQDFFKDFSAGLNGEFVWSSGLLTWQPYGDTTISANGYTYTAPSAPIYSLADSDFLKNEGSGSGASSFTSDDPVICTRTRQSDAYNDVKVEYLDRGNSYNPAIVEAKDDAAINEYGLRPADSKSLHFFCSAAPALTSAQMQLGRQLVRNSYTFTVEWYYIMLDPMDIVAITDPNLGLSAAWVRIKEITENQQDSTLTLVVEDYLAGTGSSPIYGTQVKAGYTPNTNISPGAPIAPIVFEAPVQIASNSGLEIWLLTGGGANWGGCDVYTSTDNQTYRLMGRIEGGSRIGVNNADFPSGSDPDTTDTLQVNLSTTGELYSATSTNDVDLGHTLCFEGGYPNPPAPTLGSIAGGALTATDYFTRVTYVFSSGEGPPSPEDNLSLPASTCLVVTSPVAQTGATGWNVYVGTSTGAETKQNASPISIGTNWTEPTGGLIGGTAPPPSETSYELVAYETANLVTGSEYNLGTYLRRGMYGTTISDHPAGSQFARLDGSQLAFPYDQAQIGLTLYIKLLSFNLWGGNPQTLAEVQPFQHVIEGPPLPGTVQNFSATQVGGAVVFVWDDLTDDALNFYDILYGPVGGAVGTATILTEASRATEMTNASVIPGTWIFYIRGRDIANQLGPVSSVELVVTNTNSLVSQVAQEPTWPGTLYNLYLHWTGVLVPLDQQDAGFYTTLSAPSAPTLGSVAGGSLGLTTYYVKITYVDSTGETTVSSESSLAVLALNLLTVASPSIPGGSQPATGWNVYVGTSSGSETLQNATPLVLGTGWTEPVGGLITGASPPSLNTTGWQIFDAMVANPVATAYYTAPTVDTGYNDSLRVYSSMAGTLGAGESGAAANLQLSIDTWLTGGSDPNTYINWSIGFVTMRYLNARVTYSGITAGNVSYITDFTPSIDDAPQIENNSSGPAVIAPGGTAVTFATPYHSLPNVVCTAITTGTALTASAAGISSTGFTAHVWNSSGSDVGGSINWQATGN